MKTSEKHLDILKNLDTGYCDEIIQGIVEREQKNMVEQRKISSGYILSPYRLHGIVHVEGGRKHI